MKKIILLIPMLWFFSSATEARSPVRVKMIATVAIDADADADEVWNVIKNYGDMSWHPAIINVEVDNENNTEGSVRVLTLKNGGSITQRLNKYDTNEMYFRYKVNGMSIKKIIEVVKHDNVEIPVLPVQGFIGRLSVNNENGKAIVTWTTAYYPIFEGKYYNPIPKETNTETANKAIIVYLKTGLTYLLKKFNPDGNESDISIFCKYYCDGT